MEDYPRAADLPGRRLRRRPVPPQGHDAARRVQQQQLRPRAGGMLVNEGLPLYLVSRLSGAASSLELTVGILGMAFKGGSDDNRSSLSYKLRRVLAFKAREVLTTDPFVTMDADACSAARRGARAVRPARHRGTAPRLPRHQRPPAGRRHLEPPGRRGAVELPRAQTAAVDRHPRLQRGRAIVAVLDRIVESGRAPAARCSWWWTRRRLDDAPMLESTRKTEPSVRVDVNDVRARPGPRDPIRHRPGASRRGGGHDGRRLRRPPADRRAGPVGRAGVVVAAASRYMRGGQQVGGPFSRGCCPALAGLSLHFFARVGTRDATNSFKAYTSIRPRGRHRHPPGFEIGIELVAKARRPRLPVAELPTIWLERTRASRTSRWCKWLPHYLRWCRFAFGPRLTLEQTRCRAAEKGESS